MTAQEYWDAVKVKNPALANKDVVTIKVSSIEAMVKQAHQKGVEHSNKHPFTSLFGEKS